MTNKMTPRKRGRPRLELRHKTYEATKPWRPKGMSRSTWYRRKAERSLQVTESSHDC